MSDKIYCKSGGCSAKLGAKKLSKILSKIDAYQDERMLVGFESNDDAAVYQINDTQAIVSTLDFFPPMVDDPYIFGQIAATNALSDIYAMQAKPISALNIVCFPDNEDLNLLGKIIEGGNDKLKEAQVCLAGGHSIKDDSIKYGLSVVGIVDPNKVKTNQGTKVGDVLVLTKPLGIGMSLNAMRFNDMSDDMKQSIIKSMTTLNKKSSELLSHVDVHALTDVTGFGLYVHLSEMLQNDNSAMIESKQLPYFKDCPKYVDNFYLSGAAQSNRNSLENQILFDCDDFFSEEIGFDPQTSGGLLASIPKTQYEQVEKLFKMHGMPLYKIGEIIEKQNYKIIVR